MPEPLPFFTRRLPWVRAYILIANVFSTTRPQLGCGVVTVAPSTIQAAHASLRLDTSYARWTLVTRSHEGFHTPTQQTMGAMDMQGLSTQAVGILCQQTTVWTDAKSLCTLMQVCKGWQIAAQQAVAQLSIKLCDPSLETLANFTEWFGQRSFWVSMLDVHCSPAQPSVRAAASGLISAALQVGAVKTTSKASGAGQPRGLRLCSFSTNVLSSTAALSLLPTDSLTRLQFTVPYDAQHIRFKLPSTLTRLTNLQELAISHATITAGSRDAPCQMPKGWTTCLTGLSQLTSLYLNWLHKGESTTKLPAQLQRVTLAWFDKNAVHQPSVNSPSIRLGHLTALKECYISTASVRPTAVMPLQLASLSLHAHGRWPAVTQLAVTNLQHLTQLTLHSSNDSGNDLRQLSTLSSLQHLSLRYLKQQNRLVSAGNAWKHLTSLQELVLAELPGQPAWEHVMMNAGSATTLTRLMLDCVSPGSGGPALGHGVCCYLTGLKHLQSLTLVLDGQEHGPQFYTPGDAVHLSALTELTLLDFGPSGWALGVGDYAAVSLVCELTSLQWLSLYGCGLFGLSVMPPLRKLTGLRHLKLLGNSGLQSVLTVDKLMLLTTLCSLEYLDLVGEEICDADIAKEFWRQIKEGRLAGLVSCVKM